MKRSKRYNEVNKNTDRTKVYSADEAVKNAKETSKVKFDASVELHINYQLSEKEKSQPIRGSITFPHSFTKEARVVVLTDEANEAKAKKAGADFVGLDDLVKKIEGGWFDFDVVIATPSVMPQIAKLGRSLGPKGLMPNPKTGTVTTDIESAVQTYKAGKIDFKSDDGGNVHLNVGKVSMDDANLAENLQIALKVVTEAGKRTVNKGPRKAFVTSTMGPSFQVSVAEV